MHRLLAAIAGFTAFAAIAAAQSSLPAGSPKFTARGSDGTTIHILPPPSGVTVVLPSLAATLPNPRVVAPRFGRGKLIDHGGPEMTDASFQAIYWNAAAANSTRTSLGFSTVRKEIAAFVNAFSDDRHYDRSPTDDYTIIQQYGTHDHISAPLLYLGSFVDSQRTPRSVSDSRIRRYLAGLFNSGKVYVARNVIYGVFLPPGTTAVLNDGEQSCLDFCGYHSAFVYAGMWIKYAVMPHPDCDACSISGLRVADILTIVTGHEIREAVTDPGDNSVRSWVDADGLEADDKCAWTHLYRMANGGFWMQPEYSNGGRGGSTGVRYPGPGCVLPF